MTQMEMARKGLISEEMRKVAAYEGVDVELVRQKLAEGRAVLPKNKIHKVERPMIVGEGFSVKVNANIGTSQGFSSIEEEKEKAKVAIEYGADSLMVLSTWGDLREIRRTIVSLSPVPVGSVPIYDSAVKSYQTKKNVVDFSEKDFFDMVVAHAEDGIDFMTIHVGVTRRVLERIKSSKRILKIVSRGGSIIAGWMIKNNRENPFYQYFDELLSIAKEYDITLSLGDGMRPGAVVDASDTQQFEELFVMGELVEKAREEGVQVMLEGPGHVPLNEIEMNVTLMKKIGKGAPIFLLGPLPTDRAMGYDHIACAIGGALAGYYGADFLCYVTPAEHISLPDVEDVREGVIASKIAAVVADVARGNKKAWDLEEKMALARKDFDWETMFELSLGKNVAKEKHEKRPYPDKGCSMCGPFCAIKIAEEFA
ncbi:phosphomethylpyrimidine synthase ThiC [Thermotoga sp. KOL6]|uniref:phosphomethylpyrimidine synthase ThiC n=1 Tax=Thermotoga sp. KOL6 TaxID=126741 RepID=UPI000C757491|nr:phosphomethylpyrimidine synthase ThiC [Thermotoga sp. KOL6]PLV59483.1 phosphomethylpyrimidine synthase [Thermotoga sp. KOL6]